MPSSSSILFPNSVPPPSPFTAKPWKKTDIKPIQTHDPTRSNLGKNRHGRPSYSYVMSPSSSKFACRSSPSSAWISDDLDLYELLGVESSSNQAEIKKAYRALQKRCHPDIAGPAGHDMAIILNEVYSLLSDPNSRSAYDQGDVPDKVCYSKEPTYSNFQVFWCKVFVHVLKGKRSKLELNAR